MIFPVWIVKSVLTNKRLLIAQVGCGAINGGRSRFSSSRIPSFVNIGTKYALSNAWKSGLATIATVLLSYPILFEGDIQMLSWALTFLIIALVAGALGLFGLQGMAMNVAWILFVVFLVLFLVSLVTGRRTPIS